MAEWTWEKLGKTIDTLLNEASKCGNPFDPDSISKRRMEWCINQAKLLWEQHKHLSPEYLKEAVGSWKNRQAMATSGVRAGKPPALLPKSPVDLSKSRPYPKLRFNVVPKSIDPTIVILLSDWLVDYLYARYATPELQEERRLEQEYGRNFWIYYLNGYDISGSKIEPGNSQERLQRYKEWHRNNAMT